MRSLADKKRAELALALRLGKVNDPITMMAITIGISVGSQFLMKALAPKPAMQKQGEMHGPIQFQTSELGTMWPEIYGAAPDVELVSGTGATWANQVNVSTGPNGAITKSGGTDRAWNSGAAMGPITATQDAFIRFLPNVPDRTMVLVGFSTTTSPYPSSFTFIPDPPRASFSLDVPNVEMGVIIQRVATGVDALSAVIYDNAFRGIFNGVVGPSLGSWVDDTVFQVEKRDSVYRLYKDLAEVSNFTPPTPTDPVYLVVIIWTQSMGLTNAFVQIGGDIGAAPSAGSGGVKIPAMVLYTSKPIKHSYITNQPGGGGKGPSTQQVENIYYTIDLGLGFCRGPVELVRENLNSDVAINLDHRLAQPSGITNPDQQFLSAIDPDNPPDPIPGDGSPGGSVSGVLIYDANGVGTGTIQKGLSQIAVYPGNFTQEPDPTEEAAIDAQYGTGSTVAYRGHSRLFHTGLNLQRWQNLPPNATAIWQHQTLKTLGPIYSSFCSRIVDENGNPLLVETDDYDWSALDDVVSRGMLITGRRFTPAEIIDSEDIQDVYNYFTGEPEGVMTAFLNGDEPSVTIPEGDFNWVEGDNSDPEIFSSIEPTLVDETTLPKSTECKYIDPGKDWEPNTRTSIRKVTQGNTQESFQVQVTLNQDEGQAAADRREYRRYVQGTTYRFTLSWRYMHLYPGYKIIVSTAIGITYTFRLTKIDGGVGIRNCEAVCLSPAIFDRTTIGNTAPVYNPPQPLVSATIPAIMDIPFINPENEGQLGLHIAGGPRSTDPGMTYRGFALFIKRGTEWIKLPNEFRQLAVIGRVYSATYLYPDSTVTDLTFTADSSTDIITITSHQLISGASVTVKNTGGALPSPLVAGIVYFVRDVTTNTLKLAATSGGAAINLTTNGTGTSVINVGQIIVDLYGTTPSLSSVSTADMIAGLNRAVAGDMVLGFAQADRVAGYPNRWTLSVLLNGQNNTADSISQDLTGRNFCLLTSAVQFVTLESGDLNTTLHMKAVSLGSSLDDTPEVTTIMTGRSLKGPIVATIVCILSVNSLDALFRWDRVEAQSASSQESYEFEILDTDNTTVIRGPIIIKPALLAQTILWNLPAVSTHTGINMNAAAVINGGADFEVHDYGDGGSDGFVGVDALISANLKGGTIFELQIPFDRRLPPGIFFASPSEGINGEHSLNIKCDTVTSWPAPLSGYEIRFEDGEGTVSSHDDPSTQYFAVPGDRIAFRIREDGRIEVIINYIGDTSRPLWIAPNSVILGERYLISLSAGAPLTAEGALFGVREANLTSTEAELFYPEGQQIFDGVDSDPSLRARVRHLSFYPSGVPGDWKYIKTDR